MFTTVGKLHSKMTVKSGTSQMGGWQIIEYSVQVDYCGNIIPISFVAFGKHTDMINEMPIGTDILVEWYPKCRFYNNKWYTELKTEELTIVPQEVIGSNPSPYPNEQIYRNVDKIPPATSNQQPTLVVNVDNRKTPVWKRKQENDSSNPGTANNQPVTSVIPRHTHKKSDKVQANIFDDASMTIDEIADKQQQIAEQKHKSENPDHTKLSDALINKRGDSAPLPASNDQSIKSEEEQVDMIALDPMFKQFAHTDTALNRNDSFLSDMNKPVEKKQSEEPKVEQSSEDQTTKPKGKMPRKKSTRTKPVQTVQVEAVDNNKPTNPPVSGMLEFTQNPEISE